MGMQAPYKLQIAWKDMNEITVTPLLLIHALKIADGAFKGRCFEFYLILKQLFPQAVPYEDGNHVITEIDGLYYDASGLVDIRNHTPLLLEKRILKNHYRALLTKNIMIGDLK
jgi:hypothetical protein